MRRRIAVLHAYGEYAGRVLAAGTGGRGGG